MKLTARQFAMLIIASLVAIIGYQTYWLVGLYGTLDEKLRADVREAVRKSDYEEIMYRVHKLRQRTDVKHGQMDVMIVQDTHEDETTVSAQLPDSMSKASVSASMEDVQFTSILSSAKNMDQLSIYIQQGIHMGLDDMQDVEPAYFDSLLTYRLDSLGLDTLHVTLLLHEYAVRNSSSRPDIDTLARFGTPSFAVADTIHFALNVGDSYRYIVLLPAHRAVVLRSMAGMIAVSLLIVLVVAGVMWYLVHTLMSLRTLDEMKSDFTNNMTHELKTPIAVAYAANDALLHFDGAADPKRLQRYLHVIDEQLLRLGQLVEQILSMSMEKRKTMMISKTETDIAKMVETLVAQHRLKADRPVDIRVNVEPGLTLVTDSEHLSNIISNMIDNAIKYSPHRADITIEGHRMDNGRGMWLSVSDRGMGIARDRLPYIFDKFYRVPHGNVHEVKGYGLGLYYVRTMTEKLGGRVEVESRPGEGSTFKLIFHG